MALRMAQCNVQATAGGVDSDGHHLGSRIREAEHVLELANHV